MKQLGRTVPQRYLVRLDAVAIGEQAPRRGGVAVGVPVHAPARPRDRGVHDLQVRQVGPLGAGQVYFRGALESRLLLLSPPLAPLEVQLRLVDVVELPVVVAEAHARCRERASAPAPGSRRTRW